MKKERDVEIDAIITILNYWRDGNSSEKLKLDAFELLIKWVDPEKYLKVLREVNSLSKACRNNSLSNDYILLAIDKMHAMLEYLCYCDDPELEYAGRYARKRVLLGLGILWDR